MIVSIEQGKPMFMSKKRFWAMVNADFDLAEMKNGHEELPAK